VHVCRIATGEIEEEAPTPRQRANAQNGRAGGKARAEQVDPERRRQIARQGAEARWKNRA
jgi:general stress protein YciG